MPPSAVFARLIHQETEMHEAMPGGCHRCLLVWLAPSPGARHMRSEALSTDHVLDFVGVAGSLKLDHRHWQYYNNEVSP